MGRFSVNAAQQSEILGEFSQFQARYLQDFQQYRGTSQTDGFAAVKPDCRLIPLQGIPCIAIGLSGGVDLWPPP